MKKEKMETLFTAVVYYIALACVFAILSVIFRNTFTISMTIINTTLTLCSILIYNLYKIFDNVHWIVDISSMIVLFPILVYLLFIDVVYMVICYLIGGGDEND